MGNASPENWWQTFFDDTYADIGLIVGSEESRAKRDAAVEFLLSVLELSPGDSIFDQCCGIGRLSIPLAERGLRVIGVDLMPGYIARARDVLSSSAQVVDAELFAADAFEFVAPRPCDAAINWFTSFGYDRDDARSAQMLSRAFESLLPGGRFALDVVSVPRVLREFRDCSAHRFKLGDGTEVLLLDEPEIDFRTGMFASRWTFIFADGRREERRVRNRAFMPHEIVRLLEGAGFTDIDLLGSTAGEPFERTSRRLIAVARRP